MVIALTIIHVLMCFAIIAIVLLQAGKGADIGSAFGGAGSQAVFGSMGTPTVLGKNTGVIAIIFTLTSFSLAILGRDRSSSVVRAATAAYGDTFIDSLLGNISSLIPTITGDGPSHTVGDQIYSGLVTFDKDLNPVGELAQSWEFRRDCRDLTFRLRPGVKWHDGRPF